MGVGGKGGGLRLFLEFYGIEVSAFQFRVIKI